MFTYFVVVHGYLNGYFFNTVVAAVQLQSCGAWIYMLHYFFNLDVRMNPQCPENDARERTSTGTRSFKAEELSPVRLLCSSVCFVPNNYVGPTSRTLCPTS